MLEHMVDVVLSLESKDEDEKILRAVKNRYCASVSKSFL
jgi:predicted ATP-dependent serine protease